MPHFSDRSSQAPSEPSAAGPAKVGEQAPLRCLWLTLADPDPPHNGQFIHSGGLIRSLAEAGAALTVLGLGRTASYRRDGHREGGIHWRLAEDPPFSRWAGLGSRLPQLARHCQTPAMQRVLGELLAAPPWDAIVFDSYTAGWALRSVLARYPTPRNRPKLVYISHNHEASLRPQLASSQPDFIKRQAGQIDALKVMHLERQLVRSADLIMAITPEDQALYQAEWPQKRVGVLTPGYRGRVIPARRLTPEVPRRAVIVGSFDWIAKRMNLEEFVAVADPLFAAHGVLLQVIGSGEPRFLARMRKRVKATDFTGTVADVNPYLDQARIAIVPERSGGGFKLKVLEYVFNRLPIFALTGSVAGVPLRHGANIRMFPDQEALALGVVEAIDDLERLSLLQNAAFNACQHRFDWASRGRELYAAIEQE